MRRMLPLLVGWVMLAVPSLDAQQIADAPVRRLYVGSSAFVLANVALAGRPDAPDFYQLNVGYWIGDRTTVSLEAITWRYIRPVGIPYGPSFDSPEEDYPGHVREAGVGIAYQRLLWGNFYSAGHVLPLVKRYVAEEDASIQQGFRLFLTARAGYHLRLFRGRLFMEPSIAATYWPVDTNMPAAFEDRESRWPNYFLLEPGLHFGVGF
jgi:hypothetical protein